MFKEKIRSVCTYYGIQEKDIPKVLIYTKVLTYIPFTMGLFLCYRYRPASLFLKSQTGSRWIQNIRAKYPEKYKKTDLFIKDKIKKVSESKIAMFIPKTIGLKTSRFTKSFVETIILYKLSLPITLPICFFGSLALVKNKYNLPINNIVGVNDIDDINVPASETSTADKP